MRMAEIPKSATTTTHRIRQHGHQQQQICGPHTGGVMSNCYDIEKYTWEKQMRVAYQPHIFYIPLLKKVIIIRSYKYSTKEGNETAEDGTRQR